MEGIDSNLSELRNWAELPPDILTLIFQRLGPINVLLTAQAVCVPWKRVSYEHQLWRVIDMRNHGDFYNQHDLEKMAREAIDRSCGQLIEFSLEHIGTDDILHYAADRSNLLRCLRLVCCYEITDEGMVEAAKKFPLLEELDISYCSFSKELFESVGQTCPCLKSLHLNFEGYNIACDDGANAIAQNMPGLCHLQLLGNNLTDSSLQAILDCCPNLESLDLRRCFNISFEGDLRKRCMDRIKNLRLPNDSTDDCEFDGEIVGYGSDYEEYPYARSNVAFFSENACYEFLDRLSDDEYYEITDEFPAGYDSDFM